MFHILSKRYFIALMYEWFRRGSLNRKYSVKNLISKSFYEEIKDHATYLRVWLSSNQGREHFIAQVVKPLKARHGALDGEDKTAKTEQ